MDKIVFFDGVCNLCNGFVQWVILRDPDGIIKFSSLQSEKSQEILACYDPNLADKDTIYYLRDGKLFDYSDVALEVARDLGGIYKILYIFKIVPLFIRNGVYRWIAKNRYRIFGKRDTCMIPEPKWAERFID